jgi:transcription elongation GreA/GreB family factor|tara:strand:- start:961 stop:1413 length:453 start_codon:yes stop_codon:yes gene_type:complete
MKNIKELICNELLFSQKQKIKSLELLINSTTESRDTANKSSAGDKHETSRAKIQTEIDNYSRQLDLALNNLHIIEKVNSSKNNNVATQGSLITTNKGVFFIAIGIGKLQIRSNNYFIISLLSPIGSAMKGLSKNEKFTFRGIKYSIKNIE